MTPKLEIDVVSPEGGVAFLPLEEIDRLLSLALATAGIESGHVAVEFVDAARIAELNAEYRGKAGPTDVLSFPIDGEDPSPGPCELGDILKDVEGIEFVRFGGEDVVRHKLVQRIVAAYSEHAEKQAPPLRARKQA